MLDQIYLHDRYFNHDYIYFDGFSITHHDAVTACVIFGTQSNFDLGFRRLPGNFRHQSNQATVSPVRNFRQVPLDLVKKKNFPPMTISHLFSFENSFFSYSMAV